MTVSLVARRHGIAPNQIFKWRRLVARGGIDGDARRKKRSCRLLLIAPYRNRCGSFIAFWARRRWKARYLRRPSRSLEAQKKICCARCPGPKKEGQRRMANDGGLQNARRRPLEHRCPDQGYFPAAKQRTAVCRQCRSSCGYQDRHLNDAELWLPACLGGSAQEGRA